MKKIFVLLMLLSFSFCFAQGKKSPHEPDKERVEKAALKDEGKNALEEKVDTIRYGIESEIVTLIKNLIDNDDPRFSRELYDLFYQTKSVQHLILKALHL